VILAQLAPVAAPASPSLQTLTDMGHLAPMVIVGLWSLVLLLSDAFAGRGLRKFQRNLALVGVALAAGAGLMLYGDAEYDAGMPVFFGFLVVDHFSLLLDLAILGATAAVLIFAGDYARSHRFEYGEQEPLLLIAAFGIMILGHANDLLALFLGIETMSIAVYVMVGARWNTARSSEAALKYFLMGAFSSALLLMGIALMYGALGSTDLGNMGLGITQVFHEWGGVQSEVRAIETAGDPRAVRHLVGPAVEGTYRAALLIPGALLILAAFLFKVSAVPFHAWTPDAYEGAPTPTTAFMASGVKFGGMAALLKLFVAVLSTNRLVTEPYGWTSVVALIALLTMTIGNLAAVRQTNVKRMLAYSSIAHVGYMLVGVVAAASFYGHSGGGGGLVSVERAEWSRLTGDMAVSAIVFYVVTYAVATIGAFACVAWLGSRGKEAVSAHQWSGLGQRHPAMALGMTVCLLSLMGMPPTAGFLGKLFVFRSAFENDNLVLRVLVVAALLNAVIAAYYYLRVIVNMYFRPPPKDTAIEPLTGASVPFVVAVTAALALVLGIGSNWLLRQTNLAAAGFSHQPGSEQRQTWVRDMRDRWEPIEEVAEEAPESEEGEEAKEAEPGEQKKEPDADAKAAPRDEKAAPRDEKAAPRDEKPAAADQKGAREDAKPPAGFK
jgi:NADH-quinone oxidoreductase subunit N